ncbi:nif-specific transcriptional activator NifA [Niveibacterium terrae]|uniref:nif-specific transcriptional activator NifA n=1 Tax=Niveibacterium terrae TaxID=3373598 RepID=UPI003A94A4B2
MTTAVVLCPSRQTRAQIELSTVYEIGKILSATSDLRRALRETLNILANYLGFSRGTIVLREELGGSEALELVAATGLSPEEWEAGCLSAGDGAVGKAYASGLPVVVPDIAAEPLFVEEAESRLASAYPIAFIGVPVRHGRRTLGVLSVDRPRLPGGAGFSADVRLLAMVANLIGQAVALAQVSARGRPGADVESGRPDARPRYRIKNVIGCSRKMESVFAEVHQLAPARSTVLLRGESGTGKEVIARAIHDLSPRNSAPFVKVNCAALSETLLESELFGHERGAFTGATGERKGRFELADKGTLFLDEIGDISPAFQTKLLRVLQEREFERVGGSRSIKVDVRLICATNRDLETMVANGEFRADLYFRINVVSVFLPPLRERPEDIAALAEHFLQRFNAENGRSMTLSPTAHKLMRACNWPGNVRELENCIERAATMSRHQELEALDFPCSVNRCMSQILHLAGKGDLLSGRAPLPALEDDASGFDDSPAPRPPARRFGNEKPEGERERLIWAMEQCGWVQAKAARLLNITPRQMGYALQKFAIEVRRF